MGIIKRMTLEKKESLEIAKETEKLYLTGLRYRAALSKAKEIHLNKDKEEVKKWKKIGMHYY